MKNLLFSLLALSLLVPGSLHAADDTTRRAQQALRDGGFYYGPIDGTPGDETTQAVRRYQIRNGLAVSGQFNAETLRALGINAPPPPAAPPGASAPGNRPARSEPTPPPLATPAPTAPPRATITGRPPSAAAPAPTVRPGPPAGLPPAVDRPDLRVAPLPPGAQAPSVPLTGFFARTPYEFAPPAVQADVLRRAQRELAQGGFYDGPTDGQPGRRTVEALGEFQGALRLPRSRRLDVPTLRVLRLLPGGGDARLAEPPQSTRRRAPEPDPELEEEDEAPAVRVRPRRAGPEVYEGRILR